jgi:hypothetical protein
MTPSDFVMYDGSVHQMPNSEDIRKYIFDNLNVSQTLEISAGYNPIYDEIWFKIPLFGSATPNTLLIFHRRDACWSIHQNFTRVAMTNFVNGDNRPYLGDVSGIIYQHEITNDAAGVAITTQMTLGPYAMAESMQSMDLEGIRLDPFQQTGDITAVFNTYDELSDLIVLDTETDTVSVPSGLTDVRVSGRYIGFTLSQTSLGSYFRFGSPVAWVRPTAKRR